MLVEFGSTFGELLVESTRGPLLVDLRRVDVRRFARLSARDMGSKNIIATEKKRPIRPMTANDCHL